MDYIMDYWSSEEFLEKLSIHNRIIYRRRKTPNLHRSWILFYERVLVNDVVRLAVQNDGHKFWEKDPFPDHEVDCLLRKQEKMKAQ